MRQVKTIYRSLTRHKQTTLLNILGQSLGLAAFLLIAFWIFHEWSMDRFHVHSDRIYQINYLDQRDGEIWAGSPAPLAPMIREEISGIEAVARIRPCPDFAFQYGDVMFYEANGMTADPELFDIFSFETLLGDPARALEQTHHIVITESFSHRYFGKANPLGEQLLVEAEGLLTVGAVIEDPPKTSHIQFDYILSHKFAETYRICGLAWGDPNFRTFVLTLPGTDMQALCRQITRAASAHGCPHVKYGNHIYTSRALKTIYLDYKIPNILGPTGDSRALYALGSIGIFILLLACINTINLSLSMLARQSKSVSIKKLIGAQRRHIFTSTLFETAVIVSIAFIVALAPFEFVRPLVTNLASVHITRPEEIGLWGFWGLLFLAVVLICGIYPSLLISGTRSSHVFENKTVKHKPLSLLVIVQNIVSIALIISTLVIAHQMHYLQHKELGFDSDQILYVVLRGQISEKINTVKTRLTTHAEVQDIAFKDCLPYSLCNNTTGIVWKKDGKIENDTRNPVGMETTRIDDGYFDLMEVEFVAGRNFSPEFGTDTQNYIINETAAQRMGIDNPVGLEFALYGQWGRIIGVIRDTHFKSLHDEINPQVFHLYRDLQAQSYFGTLFIRTGAQDPTRLIADLRSLWREYNPGIPFEVHFLDADYEAIYDKDRHTAFLISGFTFLAIFIACLGLFGQAGIMAVSRTKEIGIRKVNGATTRSILYLLNRDLLKWVGVAFVFACPLGYYLMTTWLQNFAYRVSIEWWIYVAAGVLAIAIALLTVSMQVLKAAAVNPVDSLRYE